jgi:succinate dehydrogenase/fumarate reductase flavoprotein subunit
MSINRRDLIVRGGATAAALTAGAATPASAQTQIPDKWDREADVVVVGSGATGLPAAIAAREAGSTVIVVEAQPHVGGHARVSGGNVPLGGGTSIQKKYGIEDSADLVFKDLTDWSVTQPNGAADYRYNDHEIIRAFADNSASTFEWLVAHGVVFVDKPPDRRGGAAVGNSALRTMHCAPMDGR